MDALSIYKERATISLKKENKKDKPNAKAVNDQRKIIDDITRF